MATARKNTKQPIKGYKNGCVCVRDSGELYESGVRSTWVSLGVRRGFEEETRCHTESSNAFHMHASCKIVKRNVPTDLLSFTTLAEIQK